jgi:hypothetical protein
VLLWLVAAAAATAVGMTAVGAIGTDIFGAGNDPLSEAEVEAMLATETQPPTTPSSEPPPTSQAPAPTEIPTAGGTVLARCAAGRVEIVSANPAQGYQADTDDGEVTFSAGEVEIEVRLRCVNDVVTHEIRQDDD